MDQKSIRLLSYCIFYDILYILKTFCPYFTESLVYFELYGCTTKASARVRWNLQRSMQNLVELSMK